MVSGYLLTSYLGIRIEKEASIVIFDMVTKMPNERENPDNPGSNISDLLDLILSWDILSDQVRINGHSL